MPYAIEKFASGQYKVRLVKPVDGKAVYFSEDYLDLPTAYKQLHAIKMHELDGAGLGDLFSRIKNIFSSGVSSPAVDKLVKEKGDWMITEFEIHRVPIESIFKSILNTISLGKFKDQAKKKGYDDIFHLFAIFKIEKDGKVAYFLTEKVPNIVIEPRKEFGSPKTRVQDLIHGKLKEPMKVSEMFARAMEHFKQMGLKFNKYDPYDNNCQVYIDFLMQALEVYSLTDFIFQPLDEILTGIARKASTSVTSLGHLFGRIAGNGSCVEQSMDTRMMSARSPAEMSKVMRKKDMYHSIEL